MDFFGIGAMELLLILVLALIVMGPRQLPQAARKLAILMRDLRRMWTELSTDFARELNVEEALGSDLRTITDTVSNLRRRPSPAALLGGLVGSDPLVPPGSPPSPAKVLFGEEGTGARAKAPVEAPPQSVATTPQTTAPVPQEAVPAPQEAAPAPQEAAPAPQEAAPVPQEAAPAPQAAAVQADEVREGDAGSDG